LLPSSSWSDRSPTSHTSRAVPVAGVPSLSPAACRHQSLILAALALRACQKAWVTLSHPAGCSDIQHSSRPTGRLALSWPLAAFRGPWPAMLQQPAWVLPGPHQALLHDWLLSFCLGLWWCGLDPSQVSYSLSLAAAQLQRADPGRFGIEDCDLTRFPSLGQSFGMCTGTHMRPLNQQGCTSMQLVMTLFVY
jgi:hypothetical protein